MGVLIKILIRNANRAASRITGLRVKSLAAVLAVSCLLALLMIGCVELNPGPLTSTEHEGTGLPGATAGETSQTLAKITNSTDNSTETTSLLQHLASSVQTMTTIITSLKEGQEELKRDMNAQFAGVQKSLDERLHQLGEDQHVLRLDVDEICQKQERLEEENITLRSTVQHLETKVEELDKESRKSNLLFFGVPRQNDKTCEQLIRGVLAKDLKIFEDTGIDVAYRVGNAILVKFQSLHHKHQVLSMARKLAPDNRLSIREDLPDQVRRRRSGLVELYKQLRADNKRAVLRSDKLITDEGVFTFDLQSQAIIKVDTPTRSQQQPDAGRSTAKRTNQDNDNEDVTPMEEEAAAILRRIPSGDHDNVIMHTPAFTPNMHTPSSHKNLLRDTRSKNV